MKEVIKHGSFRKENPIFVCDCRQCGCQFTYTTEDIFRSLTYYSESVQCPECLVVNDSRERREYKSA